MTRGRGVALIKKDIPIADIKVFAKDGWIILEKTASVRAG